MKSVVTTIIGLGIAIALIVGVIVPIAKTADVTGERANTNINTIQTEISDLANDSPD
jgi:hypothetical protein